MNYYKYISEGDTDKIIKDMGEYLSNKYSLVDKYVYLEKQDPYNSNDLRFTYNSNDFRYFEIHIDYIQIFIFSDNNIGFYDINKNGKIDNDISTFLKYHKRKETLNELL